MGRHLTAASLSTGVGRDGGGRDFNPIRPGGSWKRTLFATISLEDSMPEHQLQNKITAAASGTLLSTLNRYETQFGQMIKLSKVQPCSLQQKLVIKTFPEHFYIN